MNRPTKAKAFSPGIVFKDPEGRMPVSQDAEFGYMWDGKKLSPVTRVKGNWLTAIFALKADELFNPQIPAAT